MRTVQGELERALPGIGALPKAVAAGRTDAGVHALAMPFHVDVESAIPVEKVPEALNRLLPEDLKVVGAREVAPDFHARKDALWRAYRYRILVRPPPPPLICVMIDAGIRTNNSSASSANTNIVASSTNGFFS